MQYQSDSVINQQVTFGYGDGFNRLTSRTVTTGTVQNYTYSYDRYGDRVSQTPLQSGYSLNPTINAANSPERWSKPWTFTMFPVVRIAIAA